MKQINSIRLRILVPTVLIILAFNFISYITIANIMKKSSAAQVEQALGHAITSAAASVNSENERQIIILNTLANISQMKDPNVSLYEKSQMVYNFLQVNKKDYIDICITDTKGDAYIKGSTTIVNFAERKYVQAPLRGENYIEPPFINKVDGKMATFYSVPVYDNSGKVINVIFSVVDGFRYCDAAAAITVGMNSHPMIFSQETQKLIGAAIEHQNENMNTLDDWPDLVPVKDHILAGDGTTKTYVSPVDGIEYVNASAKLPGYNWVATVSAPTEIFNSGAKKVNTTLMALFTAALLCTLIILDILITITLRPLKKVKAKVQEIATGEADLTQRIDLQTKDEIADVVSSFNTFTQKMQEIVTEVKDSRNTLDSNGTQLSSIIQKTTTSIEGITGQLNGVTTQLEAQVNNVTETSDGINRISEDINSLKDTIVQQRNDINKSSVAIQAMIDGISDIGVSVENLNRSFDTVLSNTKEGSRMQQDVNSKIKDIEVQSQALQEANQVIAAIAEQTNLLAMNAAIEAAHAGESGKGFAVVADEIRKLSETSTEQSKTIGEQLASIQTLIDKVVNASEETNKAFESVISNFDSTDEIVKTIRSSLEEQERGSGEISSTISEMNNTAQSVEQAASHIQGEKDLIAQKVSRLQSSSAAMKSGFESMKSIAQSVQTVSQELSGISENMKESIQNISVQIDQFKV